MRQRIDTDRGLLVIEYDGALVDAVGTALGDLKSQRFKVLKNAVNATAKQAQAALVDKAQAEYAAKKGPLKRAATIKKGTDSKPEATITVKGATLELREFKTSAPKSGAKAKILNSSTLKLIQSQKGSKAKAFLATFESGHTAIVQRQDGETYRRDGAKRQAKYGRHIDMTRVKKLLSISFPKMVGGSAVLGALAPDIYDTLLENVNKEIRRVMRT
ncbi:phage tail protein [uncultured Oscillibacter sp.]|jgi:hypothetical protein|uniref:phage tail protein n=1 Tax=uncultured Oscillibacter sp. TaxID=876091 RepID=UPI00272C9D70|nr:phage tail protein [uncultured Oscillibacter sp.]